MKLNYTDSEKKVSKEKTEDQNKMRPIVIITGKSKFGDGAVFQYYLDTNELVKLDIKIPGQLVKPLEVKSKLYIISSDCVGRVKQNDDFTCVYENLITSWHMCDSEVCNYKDNLLHVGGCITHKDPNSSSEKTTSSCSLFDTSTEQVKKFPDLVVPRKNPAVVNFNQQLLVIGGSCNGDSHKSVEYYDEVKNRWVLTSVSLNDSRYHHFAVELDNNLYVFGGSHICFDSVEVLSPGSKSFTKISMKGTFPDPHSCFVFQDSMWWINNADRVKTEEGFTEYFYRYDAAVKRWTREFPFPIPITGVGACIVTKEY